MAIYATDNAREQSYVINQIMQPILQAGMFKAQQKNDYEKEIRKDLQSEADRMGRTAAQQQMVAIQNDETLSIVERWNRTQQIKGQVDALKSQWIDTQFQTKMEQYNQQNSMFNKLFGGNKTQTAGNDGYSYLPASYTGEAKQKALDSMGGLKGVQQEVVGRGMDLPYPTPEATLEQRVAHRRGEPVPQTPPEQNIDYQQVNQQAGKKALFDQYRMWNNAQEQEQQQGHPEPAKESQSTSQSTSQFADPNAMRLEEVRKLKPYWGSLTPEEKQAAMIWINKGGKAEELIKRLK